MAQATYPVLTWATRSLFKMIEPYLVLLRVEFTLQPTITSGPVRSYRTLSPLPTEVGGLLSAALVVGSRPPGVTWHPAHWSPDFPPPYLSTPYKISDTTIKQRLSRQLGAHSTPYFALGLN